MYQSGMPLIMQCMYQLSRLVDSELPRYGGKLVMLACTITDYQVMVHDGAACCAVLRWALLASSCMVRIVFPYAFVDVPLHALHDRVCGAPLLSAFLI